MTIKLLFSSTILFSASLWASEQACNVEKQLFEKAQKEVHDNAGAMGFVYVSEIVSIYFKDTYMGKAKSQDIAASKSIVNKFNADDLHFYIQTGGRCLEEAWHGGSDIALYKELLKISCSQKEYLDGHCLVVALMGVAYRNAQRTCAQNQTNLG